MKGDPSGPTLVSRVIGRSRSAVERALRVTNPTTPHGSSRALYTSVAADWAGNRTDPQSGANALGVLYMHLKAQRPGQR